MKGLGANRSRHLSDSCEPSGAPKKPLYPLTSDAHGPFLLSPTMNHYGTLDPHQLYQGPNPQSLPSECLLPLNQMSNSSTFPRLHFTSQQEQADYSPDYSQGYMVPAGGGPVGSRAGTLSTSMSMGLGLRGAPMITSGSVTISSAAAAKMNRLPSNLLDQLEKHLPLQRDGFSTLQFHRGRVAKQRSESPGRIRHIMHSVQKLFNKSQSLEGSVVKGNMNSTTGGGEEGTRQTRRSKSKDRAKTETLKQQPSRPNALGLWSSDNALESDTTTKAGTIAVGYRNPLSMMTLGRAVSDSQAPPRHLPQGYNTISAHTLKASKSSSDLKYLACPQALAGTRGGELVGGGSRESTLVKRGSWSTLTLNQARQVLQKGSATVNRTLLKTKSCHQDLTCQYLQVGGQIPLGDWSATLGGRGRPGGLEIPCRRMRSGSYVKAMGDVDHDSEESEGSPKPSPKTAARRQSYLKATHQSLSEQQPPPPLHNCLPSLRELSTNRSLDNLDCLVSPGEPPMAMRHWDDGKDFHQSYATLGRSMMSSGQVCGQGCGRSLYCEGESQAVEALNLPTPTCFRSRSHSYLRAIQAGCSQDEDTASVDSDSSPPTTTGCTYTSSPTLPTCVSSSCKKAPPPVPPRTTSKPYISVTVQSSTESAQDTYLDQQDHRSEANSQSGRSSNSSDSLCSLRTGSLAKGSKPPAPVAAPVPAPRDSHPPPSSTTQSLPQVQPQNDTLNPGPSLTPDQSLTLPEPVPTKRKLSSIGIQVDCVQPIQREDQPPPSTKFQSIGVQVENGRPLSRASSMASRQETETEPQESKQDAPTSENNSTVHCNSQPLDPDPAASNGKECAVVRQPPKHPSFPARASASLPESLDPTLDPSFLPPPDPSLVSGNGSAQGDAAAPSTCLRDGNWFLKLLQAETARMEGWCQQMEQETKDKDISEEVMGTVRSAVGSAQLLIAQKFQQFRGLCDENLNVNANPQPTAQDLAGFWDLLQLSVEDISVKFDELWQLKANNWQLPEKKSLSHRQEEKKPAPPVVPKKTSKPKLSPGKDRSIDSAVDKQRQEARKRLMAAKRAASVRQNSATESSDSIEIYVPEAQTRL
ncbi:disks large-associated protein 4 isoform X1 [Salmo salar]|uniref:Disks large-associated protein 4 isoform X1 n=1 Tax=Salmo salar TaxID=8030 RepID=A0A1S3LJE3_SALSA|nr:disks large-associated protein 4 isoform X1 [Salmo salar]|eukprot:XP_013990960.1 PREDICTED: disks large-associated protein 4-like isoform X4 [Salmo salar]